MPSPALVSSAPDLLVFLGSITPSSTLYLDLEGKDLSRNGTLSIMTILVHPARVTKLIDVQALGNAAFTTPGGDGRTLKDILEEPHTHKYLWDVRNDADALWAHHRVRLNGVTDVQLLENACRTGDKTYVRGLDTCIERDLRLGFMEVHRWSRTKREVRALMPKDIFSRRPLDTKTIEYCANDVVHLPALHDLYAKGVDNQWMEKVLTESARRVAEARGPAYEPQSKTKTLGPWGSGFDKGGLTLEECLELWDEDRMDAMQEDLLGYGDYDGYESNDNFGKCSKNAAWDDTFDSC